VIRRAVEAVAGLVGFAVGLATLVLVLVELAPGDAADFLVDPEAPAEVRAATVTRLGLDQPFAVRWARLLAGLLRLELGASVVHDRPVLDLLAEALPATALLAGATLAVAFPAGLALGLAQALRGGRLDRGITLLLALGAAVPGFAVALLLQAAAPALGLPVAGLGAAARPGTGIGPDALRHAVLPVLAGALAGTAWFARHARHAAREVLARPWVTALRARGLPERTIVLRHVLPAALPPLITLLGLALPSLVGGSVLVEHVFAWPGTGRLVVGAVRAQDGPLLVGGVVAYGLVTGLGARLASITRAVLEPDTGRA
jgi:peptide/nickel transport system permease protein